MFLNKDAIILGLAIGVFGGVARWYVDLKSGTEFKMLYFIVDMAISAIVGLLAFWVSHEMGQLDSVSACVAGFAGNLGSRVFDIAQQVINDRANKVGGGKL